MQSDFGNIDFTNILSSAFMCDRAYLTCRIISLPLLQTKNLSKEQKRQSNMWWHFSKITIANLKIIIENSVFNGHAKTRNKKSKNSQRLRIHNYLRCLGVPSFNPTSLKRCDKALNAYLTVAAVV